MKNSSNRPAAGAFSAGINQRKRYSNPLCADREIRQKDRGPGLLELVEVAEDPSRNVNVNRNSRAAHHRAVFRFENPEPLVLDRYG